MEVRKFFKLLLFSHKHKKYVYLFRFRGYDEEERKEVEKINEFPVIPEPDKFL